MVKKHTWHCSDCGSDLSIYKKGKHRLLLCPQCGIVATNPLPLLGMAAPMLISGAKKLGGAIKRKITGADAQAPMQFGAAPLQSGTQIVKREDDYLFNPEERVKLALR